MSDNKIELSGIFSEGYGVVPKKLMKAQNIKSNTKLILCYLLSYTGAGMDCFPPIEQITNDLGISKRTVIRCIKEAVCQEYISKRQIQRGRGIGRQNIYTLLFMSQFASDKKSPTKKNASAKVSNASAKNDTLQVSNSTSNNNMNNNKDNNNNKAPKNDPIVRFAVDTIWRYMKEHKRIPKDTDTYYWSSYETIKSLLKEATLIHIMSAFGWASTDKFWNDKLRINNMPKVYEQFCKKDADFQRPFIDIWRINCEDILNEHLKTA